MTSQSVPQRLLIPARAASTAQLSTGLGVVFSLFAEDTGGGFSLLEHTLEPGCLGSPIHTHTREDEYSYVLTGQLSAEIGGQVVTAEPGDLVRKPRGIPHAFWNAGAERLHFLEIISPAGFERYFEELAPLFRADGPPDLARLPAVAAAYGLEMDFDSIGRLLQKHGLRLPQS